MVVFSFRFRIVTFHVGDSCIGERDVRDIVAVEIVRFMRDDLHGLINMVKDELILVMDK